MNSNDNSNLVAINTLAKKTIPESPKAILHFSYIRKFSFGNIVKARNSNIEIGRFILVLLVVIFHFKEQYGFTTGSGHI
jgi:hypothetical protein